MSIWDEYFASFKDLTGTVIDKTGKLMDVSRLKLTSSEISKEITRRYEALGRVVYDSQKAGTDIEGLISECVKSIDALYGRLDDVNARVAGLRDKKYCANCGAVVEKSAIYCNRCGARINADRASKPGTDDADDGDTVGQQAAKKVEEVVNEVIDGAKKAADDAKEVIEVLIDSARDTVNEKAEDIADAAENVSDAVSDTAEDIADAVDDAAEDIADAVSENYSGSD